MLSEASAGLHVFDPHLRLVRVNTAASLSRRFRFSLDGMLGRTLRDVLDAFAAADAELVERTARRVLQTGDPAVDLRVRLRSRADPAVVAVASASFFRLLEADGTVLGLAATVSDITQSARAEARLQLAGRATSVIGTTLDVFHTADELCRVSVPDLADSVAVDVFDSVLRGEAPTPREVIRNTTLRRAGFRSTAGEALQGVTPVGEVSG
ncbi:PAS domain-containing protein, partial [Streptomyces erythrochromogenes]